MATGASILGNTQLDVLGVNASEVATFGNTTSNAYIRLYDNNAPMLKPYLFGLCNSAFTIVRSDDFNKTQVNIGTTSPLPGVQLNVQGTITAGNIGIGTNTPITSVHIHGGNIASTYTTPTAIRKYPPLALTSNTTQITGQAYGNGYYTVWSSKGENVPEYAYTAMNTNITDWWGANNGVFNTTTTNGTYTGAPIAVNVGGVTTSYAGVDFNVELPAPIYATNFVMRFYDSNTNPRRHYMLGSTDSNVWYELYTESNIPYTSLQYYKYNMQVTSNAYSYFKYIMTEMNTTVQTRMRISDFYLLGYENTLSPCIYTSPSLVGIGTFQPQTSLHVHDGGILSTYTQTSNTPIRMYPPVNTFNANTYTVQGQPYGNGVYALTSISPLLNSFTTQLYRAFDGNIATRFSTNYAFTANGGMTNPTTYPAVFNVFVDGNNTLFTANDFQVQLPVTIVPTGMRIYFDQFRPKTHYLLGSSDYGATWSTVYTQTNMTEPATRNYITYSFPNSNAYSMFKYLVTEVTTDTSLTSTYMSIAEFNLYGYEVISSVNTTLYASNNQVGIGTSSPMATLHVQGDSLIDGTLTVGKIIDLSGATSYRAISLYGASTSSKTVVTNDPIPSNCVLFSFTLSTGYYILSGNIPYRNLSSVMPLDTVNWASLGLYQTTVSTFSSSTQPIYVCPLVAIGGTDFDAAYFNTIISVSDTQTDYVVAVSGLGHLLQFGGSGLPTPVLNAIPIAKMGTYDSVSVRQAIQLTPIRRSYVATTNQQIFTMTESGAYIATSSNIDVFVNGVKSSNITFTQNINNNQTTFVVSLASAVTQNTPVEVTIWPQAVASNYYSAGYLYQSINNFSAPLQNVQGGGVRATGRLIVDGDVYVRGNVYSQCNTSIFLSGVQWDGQLSDIASNIIGAYNLVDGCVTTAKLTDGSVTSAKLASNAITSDKIVDGAVSSAKLANGAVTESKLNLSANNIGVGVANPRANWHVNGTIMTNREFTLYNNNQYNRYDFNQTVTGTTFTYQMSNMDISLTPVVRADSRMITLPNNSVISSWGASFTQSDALKRPYYYSQGGYLNGSYIQCTGQSMVTTNPVLFDLANNYGMTLISLVRFDASTGDVTGDKVFYLSDASTPSTRYITLQRNPLVSSTLDMIIVTPSGSFSFSITNGIVVSEWSLYVVIIDRNTNVTITRNGKLIGTGVSAYPTPLFQLNAQYNFNIQLSQNQAGNALGRMSYVAFHAYDKQLSSSELATVTSFILQGWAGGSSQTTLPCMRVDPSTYNGTPSIDFNTGMRIHALPNNPLWIVDAWSPATMFVNTSDTFPTFDTTAGTITFSAVFPTTYLDVGNRFYNINSQGITFVLKFMCTNPYTDEVLLQLGPSNDNYIQIQRDSASQQFKLVMRFNNTNYSVTFITSFLTNQIYTIVATIDLGDSIAVWINGVRDTYYTDLVTTFNDIVDTSFLYSKLGPFMGVLYTAAVYNRVFTDAEVTQTNNVLSSDIPYESMNVGSSSGRSALSITRSGKIPMLTFGDDNTISGLMGHLSFDNHLFDTAGASLLGIPSTSGYIQFNTNGRVGPSVVLSNRTGSNVVAQNRLQYDVNTPFAIDGTSVALWFKSYQVTGNSNCIWTFVDSSTQKTILHMSLSATGNSSTWTVNSAMQQQNNTYVNLATPSTYVVNSNEWHHVVTTVQTNTFNMYINGSLIASNTIVSPTTSNVARLLIGSFGNTFAPLNGEIDDMRIYSKSLSSLEIQQLVSTSYKNTIEIRGESGTRNVLTANATSVNVNSPLRISDAFTIQSSTTNSCNLDNTTSFTTRTYDLVDMTNTHQNVYLYGNTTVVRDSPFTTLPDEGAVYFQGGTNSRNFIALPYTSTQLATTNGVTFECWVKYLSYTNASTTIATVVTPCLASVSRMTAVGAPAWSFGMTTFGYLSFSWGASSRTSSVTYMSLNTWYHIAFSLSGNTVYVFLNGQLEFTATTSISVTASTDQIIVGSLNGVNTNAIVSNIRYVYLPLYTSSFTPLLYPLSISTNTLLLLRSVPRFKTPLSITNKGRVDISGTLSTNNASMFRNKVINGHMRFDQRNNGATVAVTSSSTILNTLAIDRWLINAYSAATPGAYTCARKTLVSTDLPYAYGFTNSFNITITTGFTGTYTLIPQQRVETQTITDFSWAGNGSGNYITLSFWFKSNQIGQYQINLSSISPAQSFTQLFTYSTANAWQFVVVSIPPPPGINPSWLSGSTSSYVTLNMGICDTNTTALTSPGWYLPNNNVTRLTSTTLWAATTNNYIEFTGVQLEKGRTNTPFEFRSDNVELMLCKRYFETSGNLISAFPGCETSASSTSTSNVGATIPFSTPKRSLTGYTVTTFDTAGQSNVISAKFVNRPLTSNITPLITDKTQTSFYIGFNGGAAGYSNIAGNALTAFTRGNMIFKWQIDDEL